MSQWGHDFRPEYIQLSVLHERFPDVPRIALTATADQQTRDEIARRLQLDDARQFVSSFDRPNIRYQIVEKANGRKQLLDFIDDRASGRRRHRLLPVAQEGRGDRRIPERERHHAPCPTTPAWSTRHAQPPTRRASCAKRAS